MGFTEFGSGDPQAVKRWSSRLMRETFGKMDCKALIGTSEDSVFQMLTDLDKNPGDKIYFDLLKQDRSNGVNGDSRLKGFETPLTYFQDSLEINQKRHGHAFKGMSQQRTVHDLRASGRFSLSEWWAWFIEASLLAHCVGTPGDGTESVSGALGAAAAGDTDFAGNVLTAPTAAYTVDGTGGTFTLGLIDDAVAKAKVNNPRVAPARIGGRQKYVMYLHPYTVNKLRQDASANQNNWNEIQREASRRGAENPIYIGALGEYNGVILRESEFVPRVGNVSYNVLLGAGAAAIGFGNAWKRTKRRSAGGGSYFDWREDDDDYGNEEGIAGVSCLGITGTVFDSKPFGRILVTSTDAAPA